MLLKKQKAKDLRAMIKRVSAVYVRVIWASDIDHYLLITKGQARDLLKGLKPNQDIDMRYGWNVVDLQGRPILYIQG